jgi:hypothetical protein
VVSEVLNGKGFSLADWLKRAVTGARGPPGPRVFTRGHLWPGTSMAEDPALMRDDSPMEHGPSSVPWEGASPGRSSFRVGGTTAAARRLSQIDELADQAQVSNQLLLPVWHSKSKRPGTE